MGLRGCIMNSVKGWFGSLIFITVIANGTVAISEKDKIVPMKIGNFSLPTSQQPGPLVGFGQNIVDKGDFQIFLYGDRFKGIHKSGAEIIPSFLYGITNTLSLFVQIPVAVKFKFENFVSHGLEDISLQLEGVVYEYNALTKADQITFVAYMSLPTGSLSKIPSTGYGSPTFFLGFTANHMACDWYYFLSSGVLLTTPHKKIKFGNQFLYECGLSRNICYKVDRFIFNWMIELDGVYRQRSKFAGVTDANSGGNDLYFGPSLWFSSQRFIVQGGISWIVAQHLFGTQLKDTYFASVYLGWKF